ncbi:MAG: type IX secretion system PorP/SprF family membrane protein [Flavobacteriales bacterium]|jgi:type IX secretion system PorP/SprF family membrane protein
MEIKWIIKMLRALIAMLMLVFLSHESSAQQQIGHTQFLWNQMSINPAYAGTKKALSAGLFFRSQWMGVEGAPQTENLFVHAPVAHGDFGLGLNVMRDQLGISNTLSVQGDFAYKLRFNFGDLSLGLGAEYGTHRMNWTTADPDAQFDPSIPFADISEAYYNFGFGAHFSNELMYFGLSIPRLLETETKFTGEESSASALFQAKRHIYFTGGGMWQLNKDTWIHPIFMVKYVDGAPVQPDFGVLFLLNKSFWIGPSYRWGDSVSIMLDYAITKQLKVGYAFDFTITEIQGHAGSHEFFLGFDVRKKKEGYNHPRFF